MNTKKLLSGLLTILTAYTLQAQSAVPIGKANGPWQGHSVNLYNSVPEDKGAAEIVEGKIIDRALIVAQQEEALSEVLNQSQTIDYTIEGEIEGLSAGTIYFAQFSTSGKRDSAEIKNGRFRFDGSLSEPSPVILSLEQNFVNKPLFMFFADHGLHTVTLDAQDLRNGRVKGSVAAADFVQLQDMERPFNEQLAALREQSQSDTSKTAPEANAKASSELLSGRNAAYEQFIRSHPSSPVAAWVAHRHFSSSMGDEAKLDELYSLLSPSLHYTTYATSIKETIDIHKLLAIGQEAPDFTQQDTSGRDVSLTDFRGKYVLLDFWASWCGPCRADNPNIVKAFETYQDKGFTVLGVSLDRQRQAWINAIHQDGLHWTNVSDLQFWDNTVAKQYGIRSIPSNFLIGPDGKVLAKNLKEDQLSKALEKIFQP